MCSPSTGSELVLNGVEGTASVAKANMKKQSQFLFHRRERGDRRIMMTIYVYSFLRVFMAKTASNNVKNCQKLTKIYKNLQKPRQ
jgi:hypothetical protein